MGSDAWRRQVTDQIFLPKSVVDDVLDDRRTCAARTSLLVAGGLPRTVTMLLGIVDPKVITQMQALQIK